MVAVASPEETFTPLDSSKSAEVPSPKPQVEDDLLLVEDMPQVSKETLEHLSRQLEYYFSAFNLSKDTYLQTLRDLNDGYVPATILSTFGKVQQMCPLDSYNAVIQAASHHSENLVVVHVDKETSKRVDEQSPNTLLAIGPKDLKPIDLPVTPTTLRPVLSSNNLSSIPSLPPASQVQNTIILREVATAITENDIRELFDFENCPPIKNVTKDISNYWFVTLSTSLRDDMMNVMLALRSKTLNGEPLKARLKSGINPSPTLNNEVYAGDRNLPYNGVGVKKFGGKKGRLLQQQAPRSPKDGKRALVNGNGSRRNSNGRKPHNKAPETKYTPPPQLVESQFPALEPAKDEDDDDGTKPMSSDGASTATTSTTSSSVEQKPKTGYAAALLKAAPPPAPSTTSSSSSEGTRQIKNGKSDGKKQRNGSNKDSIPKEVQQKAVVNDGEKSKVQPMSWGGRRSFADMLKKDSQDGSHTKQ